MDKFNGKIDLLDHWRNYIIWIDVRRTNANIKCQAFPLTLSSPAQQRFHSLKPGIISSLLELKREFLSRFIGARIRRTCGLWSKERAKA